MKAETETAIKALMKKATDATVATEAMQFAQAALSLAHVEATLVNSEHIEKQGNKRSAASMKIGEASRY